MTGRGNDAPMGEQLRRSRAARAFDANDPVAREWLAGALRHRDPDVARLAERAQRGEIPVSSVVAAVEHAERVESRADEVRDWLARQSRDELADLFRTRGVALAQTTSARTMTMAELPLSETSRTYLKQAGLWSDAPQMVRLDELSRLAQEMDGDPTN